MVYVIVVLGVAWSPSKLSNARTRWNLDVGALFVNRRSSDELKLAFFYPLLWLLLGHGGCSAG
jgi:hypothetical protein